MQQPHEQAVQSILNRLQRIEGQLRGIQKMVADERDTLDVLTQMSAVLAATRRAAGAIMKQRLTELAEAEDGLSAEATREMHALVEAFAKLD